MIATSEPAHIIVFDADDLLCEFSATFNHFLQLMHMSFSDVMDLYLKDALHLPSQDRTYQFLSGVQKQFEEWHDDVRARVPPAHRSLSHKSLDILYNELKLPRLCETIEQLLADRTLASIVVVENGRAKIYRR